jgi:hypothetical protein
MTKSFGTRELDGRASALPPAADTPTPKNQQD